MQANEPSTPWLVRHRVSPRARVRLFCFPYAGGAARVFRTWPQGLPDFVEVCAVQPPGRGGRLREEPYTTLSALVGAAAPALRPFMDRPFAFFGHSMGALIGFELARLLRSEGGGEPAHLFLSGCPAPQLVHKLDITHDLPERELVEELRRLKGTPDEVLDNRELLPLFLPSLRADLTATQTYGYSGGPPLACPFTVFGGLADEEVPRASLMPWREHTSAGFSLRMLPGDHFFLQTSQTVLLEIVAKYLVPLAGSDM